MKQTIVHLKLLGGAFAFFLASGVTAFSLSNAGPYQPIIERNVFALKTPVPIVDTVDKTPTLPAGIELRGISALFGRPQVLLNIKVAAKPPEQPKDRSLVMDVGQREGDVEVLEIDPSQGLVRLRNQGSEVTLNLKENAVKPSVVSMPAAPPLSVGAQGAATSINPNLARPGNRASASGVNLPVSPSGNSSGVPLPIRSLRSENALSPQELSYGSTASSANVSGNSNARVPVLSREEQAAMVLVNKERWRQKGREDISNLIPNPAPSVNPK